MTDATLLDLTPLGLSRNCLLWTLLAGACNCAGKRKRRATPLGQLAFFVEFLKASGLYER